VRILLSALRAAGACADQVALFEARFGDGVDVTEALCLSVADLFDWDWAADNLLPAPARAEYWRAMPHAEAEYIRASAPARAEYWRAMAHAEAEYIRASAPARAEYERAAAHAEAEYIRASAPARARAEYERAAAVSFARAALSLTEVRP